MQIVGTTIKSVFEAFDPHYGTTRKASNRGFTAKQKASVVLVLSGVLVVLGAYLVVMNAGESQTVGASLLAAVVGYWLR